MKDFLQLSLDQTVNTHTFYIHSCNENYNNVVLVYINNTSAYGPRQANLVLIAYASSEGSGEPAHPRSLARTFAARSYKQ